MCGSLRSGWAGLGQFLCREIEFPPCRIDLRADSHYNGGTEESHDHKKEEEVCRSWSSAAACGSIERTGI